MHETSSALGMDARVNCVPAALAPLGTPPAHDKGMNAST
jgi:hypothetical protein